MQYAAALRVRSIEMCVCVCVPTEAIDGVDSTAAKKKTLLKKQLAFATQRNMRPHCSANIAKYVDAFDLKLRANFIS